MTTPSHARLAPSSIAPLPHLRGGNIGAKLLLGHGVAQRAQRGRQLEASKRLKVAIRSPAKN
jgi:hypothetical protein